MKRLYSFVLLAMCISFAASAQHKTVTKIEGCDTWGYYTEDDLSDKDRIKCAQYQGSTISIEVAMEVPGSGKLKGTTIQAFNVAINQKAELSNFYIFILNADKSKVLYKQTVTTTEKNKWTDWDLNTVTLKTPFVIDQDIIVGMGYKGTSIDGGSTVKHLLTEKTNKAEGSLWYRETSGSGKWWDLHGTYGALPLQLQVTGMAKGDLLASFAPFTGYSAPDTRCVKNVTVFSDSKVAVTDISYTVTVDGKSKSYDTEVPIEAGDNKSGVVEVVYRSPATAGAYTVQLTIDKVNGETNGLAQNVTECHMINVSRKVERKTVMEEYTGAWCGNCPLGMAGIETLLNYYPDNFIPVAYHYGTTSTVDRMTLKAIPNNPGEYPKCMLDRDGSYIDPFFGSSTDHTCEGIVTNFDAKQEIIPTVDVTCEPQWVDDTYKKVIVKSKVEALADGKFTLAYILTADSLYNASWPQTNYLYSYTQDQWHGNDFVGVYCKDGALGQAKFVQPYEHVAIATSYKVSSSTVVNQTDSLNLKQGEFYNGEFTLTLPISTTYATSYSAFWSAIKASKDKVYAIVMVLNSDGEVANACKVKVPGIDTGIDSLTPTLSQRRGGSFDLNGRKVDDNYKGLEIQDGKLIIKKL